MTNYLTIKEKFVIYKWKKWVYSVLNRKLNTGGNEMDTREMSRPVCKEPGLYRPEFEHDNCGIGAVVNIKGIKTHQTVENALSIVENLEHRAGKDAEGKTGDGVGIMLQISHRFFHKTCLELGIFLGEERDYGVGMFFFPQDVLKRNQAK